jgi:hypothetical protein
MRWFFPVLVLVFLLWWFLPPAMAAMIWASILFIVRLEFLSSISYLMSFDWFGKFCTPDPLMMFMQLMFIHLPLAAGFGARALAFTRCRAAVDWCLRVLVWIAGFLVVFCAVLAIPSYIFCDKHQIGGVCGDIVADGA